MASPAILKIDIIADATKALKAMDSTSTKARTTGDRLKGMASGIGLGLGVGAVVAFGKSAVDASSDLNETLNKSKVVFGDQAAAMEAWSSTAAESMGISQTEALATTATFGDMFAQMGFGGEEAAATSQEMVKLAADLGSFHNVDPSDVLERMSGAFRGEFDSIQKLIPGISAARVEQEALAASGKTTAKDLTAMDKALAVQAIMLKDSANAAGDFAETSDSLANQQRIAAAQTAETTASLGNALQPAVTAVMAVVNDFLPILESMAKFLADNVSWIGPLVAIILVIVGVVKTWTIVQAILNSTLLANPVFLIVAGIAALVAGLIVAYKKSEAFRKIVDAAFKAVKTAFNAVLEAARAVFNWIKKNWPLLLAILTGPFGLLVLAIVKNWDSIKAGITAVISWISEKFTALGAFFSDLWSDIAGFVGDAWETVKDGIEAAVTWIEDKFDALVSFFTGIGSDIADALKAPINFIIGGWNRLSIKLPTIDVPDWLPGPDKWGGTTINFPDIPKLARGGVLTRPTMFLGGESGREIVSPERLLRSILRQEAGGTYTLNVYPRKMDAASVAWGFRRLELARTAR